MKKFFFSTAAIYAAALLALAPLRLTAEEKTVYILNTTDTHASFSMPRDGRPGVQTLVDALKKEKAAIGGDAVLLIDCGDMIQGGFAGAYDLGATVIKYANTAGVDAWIPGNHDFEYGTDALMDRIKEFNGKFICGNLLTPRNDGRIPKYHIFKRNGLSICVIGLTNQHIGSWLFRSGFSAEKCMESLDAIMPETAARRPDITIIAVHDGRFTSKRFKDSFSPWTAADKYPQTDLILGGHSHIHEAVPLGHSSRTLFVQSGARAEGYSRIKIVYDTEKKKRVSLESEYITLKEKIKDKKDDGLADIRKAYYEKAGTLDSDVTPDGAPAFFARILREKYGADIVFHGALSGYTLKKGNVRSGDIFEFCPFDNTAVVVKLTPAECRAIIAEQKNAKPSARQQAFGVKEDGSGALLLDSGRAWSGPEEEKTAVFNSFYASGAGMRFPVTASIIAKKQLLFKEEKIRSLIIEYIKRQNTEKIK